MKNIEYEIRSAALKISAKTFMEIAESFEMISNSDSIGPEDLESISCLMNILISLTAGLNLIFEDSYNTEFSEIIYSAIKGSDKDLIIFGEKALKKLVSTLSTKLEKYE